jgi:hypothetical protein
MAAFVVDTNVPIVANGKSHADPACVIACVDALLEVRSTGVVVLDDGMRILSEYMNHLSLRGEPGAGDAFMKWVWSVQADENQCERVFLTLRRDNGSDDFAEFPDDPDLATFDWSDRKFVAAALASHREPVILNAVDSDWAESYDILLRNGVRVRFLCPQHVAPENESHN